MKRIFFLIGFICFVTVSTHAQIMFQRHYGGSGDEYGSTCIQTSDGGYIVTGSTDSYGLGGRDIYVVRTNEYGDTIWKKTCGGNGDDQATCIIETNDGGYAITGITSSFGAGSTDVYLIKINQNGDTIWTKTYGGSGAESGYCLLQTPTNDYIISGFTESYSPVTSSIYIIKTDSNGDTLWAKTYYKQDVNTGYAIIQTVDNNYLVGITLSNTVSTHDYMIAKIDSLGDTLWTKVYDKGANDWFSSVVELDGGDFVVSGFTNSLGYGGYDMFLARYNSSGDEIWFKTYGGTEDDLGGGVIFTNDLSIINCGSTFSFGKGGEDFYLVKINLNGDTIWTKTYGGIDNDYGGSIMQTTDGGLIIGGSSSSYGNGSEIFLIKTNPNGYAGIDQNCSIIKEVKIYPNPNNGVFTIEQENLDASSSALRIFDINGKLVYSLPHIFQHSMTEKIEVPDLGSGVYFLTISDEYSNTATKLTINK
ncbi:MAG: T9SS type A sorting domain-containing protein [Bacteroidales bacterium]